MENMWFGFIRLSWVTLVGRNFLGMVVFWKELDTCFFWVIAFFINKLEIRAWEDKRGGGEGARIRNLFFQFRMALLSVRIERRSPRLVLNDARASL